MTVKMGGISLQGAHGTNVRRVSVSGFSIGIDADNSTFVTIEDTNINLSSEEGFLIRISEEFPQLNAIQAITVKSILREFRGDKDKRDLALGKIAETVSAGSGFIEAVSKIYGTFFGL